MAKAETTRHEVRYEPVPEDLLFGRSPYRCTACGQRYHSEKVAGYYDCHAATPDCEHTERYIQDGDLVCADCHELLIGYQRTDSDRDVAAGIGSVPEPVGSPDDWYLTREERGY